MCVHILIIMTLMRSLCPLLISIVVCFGVSTYLLLFTFEVAPINDMEAWVNVNPYWMHFACFGFWFLVLFVFEDEHVLDRFRMDWLSFRNRRSLKKMF